MVCAYDCPAGGATGWSKRPGSLGPNRSSKGRVAIVVQAATRTTTATEDTIRRMRTTHGWRQWAALYPAAKAALLCRGSGVAKLLDGTRVLPWAICRQTVRFTSSFDGVRLAYGVCGRGHPLVRVPTWISHVEHDWLEPGDAASRRRDGEPAHAGELRLSGRRPVRPRGRRHVVRRLGSRSRAVVDAAGLNASRCGASRAPRQWRSPLRCATRNASATWCCVAASAAGGCGATAGRRRSRRRA